MNTRKRIMSIALVAAALSGGLAIAPVVASPASAVGPCPIILACGNYAPGWGPTLYAKNPRVMPARVVDCGAYIGKTINNVAFIEYSNNNKRSVLCRIGY